MSFEQYYNEHEIISSICVSDSRSDTPTLSTSDDILLDPGY